MTVLTPGELENQKKGGKGDTERLVPSDEPLPEKEKPPVVVRVFPSQQLRATRKRRVFLLCTVLLLLALAAVSCYLVLSYFLKAGLFANRHYHSWCRVMIPEHQTTIREKIDLDKNHLLTTIPAFNVYEDTRVLHLFQKRITVIRTKNECFIKPMRADLRPPANLENLIEQLLSGRYVPSARLIREHWMVEHPALPQPVLFFLYHPQVAELCNNVPAYRMVARPDTNHCPMISCDRPCPFGQRRVVDAQGCPQCRCQAHTNRHSYFPAPSTKVAGPISISVGNNCPKIDCSSSCELGYLINRHTGCPTCACVQIASRKRRAVLSDVLGSPVPIQYVSGHSGHPAKLENELDSSQNNLPCPPRKVLFEGLFVGDPRNQTTIDIVHDCPPINMVRG